MQEVTSVYLHPEAMLRQREAIFNWHKSRGQSLNDNELELACFRALPFGHALKADFCLSMALMRWDFLYVEKDGILNYWFIRIIRALCTHRRVFMIGSASSGKTFGAGVWGMNTWASSPWDTSFLVTSTDKESLDSKAWGTIRDLHEKDKFKIGVRVDYEDAIVLEGKAKQRDIRDSIKAIALPKGSEGEKAIGKVQGRKNKNIIWLRDEYDHMDGFVKLAEGNLMSAPSYNSVSCSNKPEEGGPMWQEAVPDPAIHPLGWEDPNLPNLTHWLTADGALVLYFDGEKSPNTLSDKVDGPFEMLTRKSYITALREKGTDSLEWWKYIKAFPKMGAAHDRLMTLKALERFGAFDPPVWQGDNWITVCGLDAAWTKGGDDCMADFGRVGVDFRGVKVLAHEADSVKINARISGAGTYEEQLSNAFLAECKKRDCHVVAIDISGSGGRMANAIRNAATTLAYRLEIITVDSSGSPDENEVYDLGDRQKNGKELFDRRVSELWYGYRLDVDAGLIRGCVQTSKAVRELCERRIKTDERRRFEVEKKDDYKDRNQGRSPDSAESRVLCRFAARKHGLGANLAKSTIKKAVADFRKTAGATEKPAAYVWSGQKSGYNW